MRPDASPTSRAIFDELCKMLDHPGNLTKASQALSCLSIGPQGSGKTTTCTKYAYYHQKKGWKPALVCADTSSAAAVHQSKQNATSTNIPFYRSCMESDPVKIAVEGVDTFKKDKCDMLHKWEIGVMNLQIVIRSV
ncbi:signal recognition particle 54 kDa protein 2 [Tanacetum coccineum]|uniref:Signal recognition particle 54 kDa protein 2 n=1 Tax=Tanacetum coccineum TaxID=301880 RepID=A0ABQ4Z2K0_9ASTR